MLMGSRYDLLGVLVCLSGALFFAPREENGQTRFVQSGQIWIPHRTSGVLRLGCWWRVTLTGQNGITVVWITFSIALFCMRKSPPVLAINSGKLLGVF